MELIKYSVPTKLETAPFGTVWKALVGDSGHQIYLQTSKDEQNPQWERAGYVLEKVFQESLKDDVFIERILKQLEAERVPVAGRGEENSNLIVPQ